MFPRLIMIVIFASIVFKCNALNTIYIVYTMVIIIIIIIIVCL